jgi:hypothetical protein
MMGFNMVDPTLVPGPLSTHNWAVRPEHQAKFNLRFAYRPTHLYPVVISRN